MKKIQTVFPIVLQAIIYVSTLILFKIFCRLEVRGLENLKGVGKKVIFAANHSSEWDGILVRTGLPFFSRWTPMYYVSMTKEHYTDSGWRQLIYGGRFFEMLGAYAVYSGKKDYYFSLQNYLNILGKGKTVCIFPEGRRTKDGNLGPAHGGLGFLVHTRQVSVVPVAIHGLVRFSTKELLSFRRHVIIDYGKPLQPQEIISSQDPHIDEYKAGAQKVMDIIGGMLKK